MNHTGSWLITTNSSLCVLGELCGSRPKATDAGLLAAAFLLVVTSAVHAQGPPGPLGPPKTPKEAARVDLTGYWVSIVTEDWRFRMVTAPKGDYPNVPLNAEGKKVADGWDPAKDEAASDKCKAYGAPNIMRQPGRLHITWADAATLKIETD